MSLIQNLKSLWSGKATLSDVWHYIVGNYRMKLYYHGKAQLHNTKCYALVRHPLMRSHIYDQINYRIQWMDRECYLSGSCKICGCQTTNLQMANKACDKPCYPPMMNRKDWDNFLNGKPYFDGQRIFVYLTMQNKIKVYKA